MSIHVFGIRHHGPGCARSLAAALDTLRPDVVLLEGPPDADALVGLASDPAMKPPVAVLIYAVDTPARAAVYPFAEFSPEWIAIQHATRNLIPCRFIDLPQSIQMAIELQKEQAAEKPSETSNDEEAAASQSLHDDPIGVLATAAGYSDHELWWEHQVEQRQDATGLFEAILDAMREVRSHAPDPIDENEVLREAHMRTMIRAAVREGFSKIAVICGAWHAPVLAEPGPAKPDADRLKGAPRLKVASTWIPWSYSRLAFRSGYGAGVSAPNWYRHLWHSDTQAGMRWIIDAARLLRGADLDASSANVIESFRLAEAVAALRDLPMAGLQELNDGIRSVLCHGNPEPMALIRTSLEIGDALGEVPASIPQVPLQRDLEQKQKQLRLKATTEIKTVDLDLRGETDLGRSRLLHQLTMLDIPWGRLQPTRGKGSGTFHEVWQLQWQVDFPIRIIEASLLGNTVETAASRRVTERARVLRSLPDLTVLLESSVLAELSFAVDAILERIRAESAVAADLVQLMSSIEPLARVARYGNVRGSQSERVTPVIHALFERSVVGLSAACSSLDDEAAAQMLRAIRSVQVSVDLLEDDEMRSEWIEALRNLSDDPSIHGLVRGGSTRVLFDRAVVSEAELQQLVRLNLNAAVAPHQAAVWLEGLMSGSAVALLHQDMLWSSLDEWVAALDGTAFADLLPLLRRSFAAFHAPERRKMAERILHRSSAVAPASTATTTIDRDRADRVLPVLAMILGATLDT
jgi:hypothetical protein